MLVDKSCFDHFEDCILIFKQQSHALEYINKAAITLLDFDYVADRQYHLTEVLPKDCYQQIFESDKCSLLESLQNLSYEIKTTVKNKKLIIHWKLQIINADQGRFCLLSGRNITESKLDSLKLTRSEKHLQSLINHMPGNFYWKDLNSLYVNCNNNTLAMLGLSSIDEIIGKSDYDLWPEEGSSIIQNDLMVIRTGRPVCFEESIERPNQEKMYFTVIKVPLFDENNQIVGIIGNSLDITELKTIQKALRKEKEKAEASNLAKSSFLATVSHELRTPLNGILGMAQAIRITNSNDSQEIKKNIMVMEESAINLLKLINDILDFAKIEAEKVVLDLDYFLLEEMIEAVVSPMRSITDKKMLSLTIDAKAIKNIEVNADRLRLTQILNNIIGNAVKFTQQGGISIKINTQSVNKTNKLFIITIADTGIGIEKKNIAKIYERFTQVETSFNRRYEGAGLGLSIAKGLIDLMNGHIEIQSILHQGTTFTLRLPFCFREVDDSLYKISEKQVDTYQSLGLKILMVEDNVINQLVMSRILDKLNCHYDIAIDAAKSFELATKHQYDVILMDLSLPDLDGIKATKKIFTLVNYHPIIYAVTAHIQSYIVDQCYEAGMAGVFTKPIIIDEFYRQLSQHRPKLSNAID